VWHIRITVWCNGLCMGVNALTVPCFSVRYSLLELSLMHLQSFIFIFFEPGLHAVLFTGEALGLILLTSLVYTS
jgi:hypothetical protein